jgi:hypothetical protein
MAVPNEVEQAIYNLLVNGGGPLGLRVARAAAAVPQAAWQAIFTITGGNILVTAVLGERTVIQAGGADTMQMRANPTAGAAVNMDIGTLITTADAVGTLYTLTGNPVDPIQSGLALPGGLAGGLLATGDNVHGWIIPIGDIEYTCTAAAGTGSIAWTIFYIPLDLGALAVAA